MVSKFAIKRLGLTAGLVAASMFVFEAAEHHLWANLMLALMVMSACLAALLGEAREVVPEPPVSPPPAERETSVSALLDQVPIPLLSYHFETGVRALNRAARNVFRADDCLSDVPPELIEAFGRTDSGIGKIIRLFDRAYAVGVSEISMEGKTVHLASLVDVQSEVRLAEATALRDLLRVLSHEIMNSLTPVASLAGVARKNLEGETSQGAEAAREALDFLSHRAQGLARFVEAYRSLARLPDPVPRPVNVGALIHDVVRVFEQSPAARDISIDMDLSADIPSIDLDDAMLAQAVINVLTNAAEACGAMEGQRRIGISVVRGYDEVEIRIYDNGAGIADDLKDKIFHAFVTTKPTGTGTGLNLARQIALAHGGDLVLMEESSPWTTGFSFVFRISPKAPSL